jgi:topoisomerase-4 subunit B
LGKDPEMTRFKGLGEISPDEFKAFIGPDMRIDPVILKKEYNIQELMDFYMGNNTPERCDFILENLIIEE